MSLQVIITGVLTTEPRRKISSNGNPYATALMSVPTDAGYLSCSVTAFNEAGKLLGAMGKGDQVAISGTASLSEWEQNSETKHGISVLAMQVMTPYQKSKRQKAIQKASEEDFDDSLDSI
jgi:single-stranded DNA-binding protein